jgi:cell division protein FtsB
MARSRGRVSHTKEALYIVCIVIILLIGLFSFVGPQGYLELKRTEAELEAHRARVEQLNKSKEEHLREINSLGDGRDNNDAIERYARKKGYGKKGELVQEVPRPEPPPTSDLRPPTSDPKQKAGEASQKK